MATIKNHLTETTSQQNHTATHILKCVCGKYARLYYTWTAAARVYVRQNNYTIIQCTWTNPPSAHKLANTMAVSGICYRTLGQTRTWQTWVCGYDQQLPSPKMPRGAFLCRSTQSKPYTHAQNLFTFGFRACQNRSCSPLICLMLTPLCRRVQQTAS